MEQSVIINAGNIRDAKEMAMANYPIETIKRVIPLTPTGQFRRRKHRVDFVLLKGRPTSFSNWKKVCQMTIA